MTAKSKADEVKLSK